MTLPSPLPYQFEDPLGGFASFPPPVATSPTSSNTTNNAFGLSAWHCRGNDDSDDDDDDDSEDEYDSEDGGENDEDDQQDHRCGWRSNTTSDDDVKPSFGKHSLPSSPLTSSSSKATTVVVLRVTRVRFQETPQICCYERIDRDLFSRLFYSCHELQKIMDEANQEKKNDGAAVVQTAWP